MAAMPQGGSTSFLSQFGGGDPMQQSAAAGQAFGVLGGVLSGLSEEQGLFAQGTRYRQQAALDLYQGGLEVNKNSQEAIQALSGTRAAAGAGGVTSSGSPHQDAMETINHANIEDAAARFAAKTKSNNDLYEAQVQDYEGKQALMSGILGAAQSAAEVAILA